MRSTHGKAIAALICGIAGLFLCQLVGIAAVILGPQARREIAAQPDRYEGDGMAKAGLILGWISIGVLILEVIALIVLIAIGFSTSSTTGSSESLAAFAA